MKLTNRLRQFFAPQKHWGLIDYLESIGGLTILMYFPIVLGLIWHPTRLLFQLLGTNSVLFLLLWIIIKSQQKNKQ